MAGPVRNLGESIMPALALAATLVLCGVTTATAAPSCRELEADLVRTTRAAGAKSAQKYADAIARQRDQIARARQRASASGCGFSIFARKGSQCAELNETIRRMAENLKNLQETRAGMGKGSGRAERGRILASLDANGCRSKKSQVITTARSGTIPVANEAVASANAGVIIHGTGSASIYYPANRPYRTQCVRICDGYFFPMSKSTRPADFQRDQNRCESACPGTRVEMFYSPGKSDDTASMISAVTGRPYRDLPKALDFRRLDIPTDPACGCAGSTHAQAGSFAGDAPSPPVRASTRTGSSVSTVEAPRNSDAANAITELSAETAEKEAGDDRRIRVVGPTFLPDL